MLPLANTSLSYFTSAVETHHHHTYRRSSYLSPYTTEKMSATLNVLRWSALGAGVVYGFVHNRTLYSQAEKKVADAQFKKQEKLIDQAKAEWARLHPAPVASTGVVTDISDDKFDIEAYLQHAFPEKA